MFVVYGTGGGRSTMGELGSHVCPECNQEAPFVAVCDYRYGHIYWLLSLVYSRSYAVVCSHCGAEKPVEKAMVRSQFRRDNIPLLRRWGWAVVPAFFLFIAVMGGTGSASRGSGQGGPSRAGSRSRKAEERASAARAKANIARYGGSPQAGDMYVVNLYHFPDSGYGPGNELVQDETVIGLMLLDAIDGDTLTFKLANFALSGGERLDDGEEDENGSPVFSDFLLSKEELQALHGRGGILDIHRPSDTVPEP